MSGIPFTEEEHKIHSSITYNEVANKLLKDKLLLTALELHTELLESGRELKQLKDFFSNPGNFEYQTQEFSSRISRSGSQVTLDSLDLTRLSEDGAGTDERVAVLEFELRKAKETINSLRNHLTVATESESSSPDKGSLKNINVDTIKPHEQRALNFLINEYLLLHNYKLTSITFADENQNQDFDDWDDVGLNIAKPPELLSLYREGLKQMGSTYFTNTIQTQTNDDGKVENLQEEIGQLRHKLNQLESEQLDLKNANSNLVKQNELLCSQISASDDLPLKNTLNSKDSFGSESPSEKFEIIDKSMSMFKKTDSITTLEDNISNNSFNTSDWMNVTIMTQDQYDKNIDYEKDEKKTSSHEISSNTFNIDISNDIFKKEVFALCYVNIPQKIVDNEVLENVFNNSVTSDSLIHVLSVSLLRIIPNIILIKREEAIPLLISAVHLNPNSHERDKLLQQLFNLKKKPNDSERFMILAGIVGIAKFSEETFVENEILPQCWEQLAHKYVEKRLLVAEACIALIPYVSSQIRNSLILSMLQQMLDDRDVIVRKIAIRALSLVVALCDDDDKYSQCEELVLTMLNDSSLEIVNLSRETLFPVLSKWALSNGRLTTSLIKSLLQKLNDCLRENDKIDKTINVINTLESILPFLLMSVVDNPHVINDLQKDMTIELRNDLKKICSKLTNPLIFYSSNDVNVSMMLYQFENYISKNPKITWPEMDWIIDMMIPDLINNLNHIESNQQVLLQSFIGLFSTISIVFGRNFTKLKIRPILRIQIDSLVQIMSSFSQFCPNLNLIPVYLVSVLSFCDQDELMVLLKKFICALPLCGTPLECLELTVHGLSDVNLQEVVVTCLWEGVVHQKPLVRAATANLFAQIIQNCDKNLLVSKITPAIVTLASDSDVFVRTAAIPALGSLITNCNINEIHDKVYLQIQSYIADTNLKENHSLLRQLIVTLGQVTVGCTPYFRNEVILPQLCSFSSYMLEMTNQTRKVDLAQALVEAYTNVVYGPFNKQNLGPVIIPGLRCLENVVNENQSLACHRETVLVMMRECDEKFEPPVSPSDRTNKLSHNVNQGVEEMRQRVSKIFNKPASASSKPNTLPNLQGIFKKK